MGETEVVTGFDKFAFKLYMEEIPQWTKSIHLLNIGKQNPKLLFLFRLHFSIAILSKDALGIQVTRLLRYVSHSSQEGHQVAKLGIFISSKQFVFLTKQPHL